MFFKKELLILIIISVLMEKIKTTKGRIYEEKHKNLRELNKLNFHSLQTRHFSHYFHKKHYKCNLERSYYKQNHVKKFSRYPTLDKIVHRLDNQIDLLGKIKMTTTNPFDEWNMTSLAPTTSAEKSDLYAYVTVGFKKENSIKDNRKAVKGSGDSAHSSTAEDLNVTPAKAKIDDKPEMNTLAKDFVPDNSTSSPWENEQQDINSHAERTIKTSSEDPPILPTFLSQTPTNEKNREKDLNLDNVPFWSLSQLLPKLTDGEDKKKKTTPLPYVAAHAHYDQVLRLGDCHVPKEKVIRVHEVHPDPSKSYSPSCTILHQCADDTGCCRDLKQVCKPKNTTQVELYFFTTTVGKPQTVEKLHFVNHTECECQKRTEEPLPRDSEFRKIHPKKHGQEANGEAKRKKNSCTCPSRYSARFLSNTSCICDCFDKQDDCLILKKGKTHFSYHDKLCIQSGVCLVPSCEFGSYIRQFGRCPNKTEKYHYSWSRILSYRDLIT